MPLRNAHDKFFKESFSRRQVAAALIRQFFPDDLRSQLDLDTLELANGSYVDETLNEYFADLIYTCRLTGNGQPVQIALLLEHKSYAEKYPHFQLLRYLLNAWQQADEQKQPLTPIIPVIIYHGESRWAYQPLAAYFDPLSPALYPFMPDFRYLLIDLTQYTEEQIIRFENGFLALAAFLLRVRRLKQLIRQFSEPISRLLQFIEQQQDSRFITTVFIYMHETSELTPEEIIPIFRQASDQTGKLAMTAADQLRLEGRQKATFEYIRGLLAIGLTAEKIAEAFRMSVRDVDEIIRKIRSENNP